MKNKEEATTFTEVQAGVIADAWSNQVCGYDISVVSVAYGVAFYNSNNEERCLNKLEGHYSACNAIEFTKEEATLLVRILDKHSFYPHHIKKL